MGVGDAGLLAGLYGNTIMERRRHCLARDLGLVGCAEWCLV